MSGLVILSATVLMPAEDDLARARANRDRALALETHRSETLANHLAYLDGLTRGDETVLLSLAASQLNLAPSDREVIIAPVGGGSVSPLDRLGASYAPPLVSMPPDSVLHRLATDRRARLWLIAAGAMCVLYGLLPAASGSRRRERPRRTWSEFAAPMLARAGLRGRS